MYYNLRYYKEAIIRKIRRPEKDIDVDLNLVDHALEKGVNWLERKQNDDGSIGLKRWEIWETANAVLAKTAAGVRNSLVKDAIKFIIGGQMDDGGFFPEYLPPSRDDLAGKYVYCIETTSVALMAIYNYAGKITPEIKKGVDFLIAKQHECGGWELPYFGLEAHEVNTNLNYFPSVTGYALQPILYTKMYNKQLLKKALQFLESTQHSDGSWGGIGQAYSTEGYAIKNISNALVLMKPLNWSDKNGLKIDKMLSSCISYSKNRQNIDGSWSIKGFSTKSLSTSLFLQTLLNVGEKEFTGLGVNWLLKQQENDGFWRGGTLDNTTIDTFVTSESLLALTKYKGKMPNI